MASWSFTRWPDDAIGLEANEVAALYRAGHAGVIPDPDADARFDAEMNWPSGDAAAHHFGIADSGAGKLVIPFLAVEQLFPGGMPGPAQDGGSCVSHGTKNAGLITMACEIVAAKPDEVTGEVEGKPEISATGITNGVISTEAIYWWRRHGGHGWSNSASTLVVCNESGLWIRKNYDGIADLETYNKDNSQMKWGARTPPDNVLQVGKQHLMRAATRADSFESLRDLLHNGYGVVSDGSEGYASRRNEDGVSGRSGFWSHSMVIAGVDDRDIAKQKYGEPLVLIGNSWGSNWNSGPRRILGTTQDIPEGYFWTKWSDCSRRTNRAFSGFHGFPPQQLPDWGHARWAN